MSTEVPEAAVEEVSGALTRNFASFPSQQWVDIASGHVKSGGNQAAAQLAPGEPVEWLVPGIMHRHGKTWPGAVLLVTPHRLIISASRGSIRTKREISSLYRGPESLIGVSQRVLPGGPADYWTLEINSQQGPFLFAIPTFTGSDALAQITAAFIAGRARYTPETGTLLDGAPWGPPAAAPAAGPESGDPFQAARADFVPAEPGSEALSWPADPVAPVPAGEADPASFWGPPAEQPAAPAYPTTVSYEEAEQLDDPYGSAAPAAPAAAQEFWSPPGGTAPLGSAPLYTPDEPAHPLWSPAAETPAPAYEPPAAFQAPAAAPEVGPYEATVAYQEPPAFEPPVQYQPPSQPAFDPPAQYQPASFETPAVSFTPAPEPEPEPEPVAEAPAADWYPDPLGQAGLRYWDGSAWTHNTAN